MNQFDTVTDSISSPEPENVQIRPENVLEKDFQVYETEQFKCSSDYRNKLKGPEETIPKPAVFLAVTAVLFIFAFSLYCIIARTFDLKEGFYSPDTGTTVILGLNSRPEKHELRDESGRYTSEGICEAVGPSVVEILIYDTKKSKVNPISSGSGIILSDNGFIVTNAHVITTGNSVKVALSDKTVFDAKIIGYDAKTDLGVIKISPGTSKLRAAEFGNSEEVVQGEQVMAIGNPGGLHGSISGGFVSGINRMIRGDSTGREMNCIQTDAAISPGNSGGALVNMFGQVIGITSSKYVSSSYEGLGFAIAVNDAKPVIEELIANGFISGRFKVGISFYEITEEQSKESGLPQGLLIDTIDEECDISESGLKTQDIIVEVEGSKVSDYDTFMEAINGHGKKAGDRVHAKAVRIDEKDDKKRETFSFEFTLKPDTSGDY
ncbi:MAG: trypsin-like peptidase domain-containing protein [Oscillospiraceae bacterium]|nr:trypsin-like peptidase domain-containing protein [Oscillospiraceae bacterium]